jgi:hypothetical protein
MTNYLNEAAYRRWLRQYQIHLANYMDRLNTLGFRIDDLPRDNENDEDLVAIQSALDMIDEHLERIVARDFSEGAEPLQGGEKFVENIKVLCNLIANIFKRPDPFLSIYQQEKDRVMKEHKIFKFKEKLLALLSMIELAEARETIPAAV